MLFLFIYFTYAAVFVRYQNTNMHSIEMGLSRKVMNIM